MASSINARRPLPLAFSYTFYPPESRGLDYCTAWQPPWSWWIYILPPSFLGRYITSVDPKGCLPQHWTITFLTSLSSLYVSSVFLKHISDTALNAPITIDTAVTLFSFHKFPISSQIRQYFSVVYTSLSFSHSPPGIAMSMILASLAYLPTTMMSGLLASTIISYCKLKTYRTLKSPFSTTRSGICLYHWSSRSSLAFPYIYHGPFQQPLPCSLPIYFRHVPDILLIHFSYHLFSIPLFLLLLHSLASFVSFTVTVPLSPNFLSDTSSEFLTYQLKLFSSPLTQASQLISSLPSLFLDRYIFAVSLLGCSSYLLSSPSWSFRRCFGVHSLFIWSLLHIAVRLQSICLQLWFCFRHSI